MNKIKTIIAAAALALLAVGAHGADINRAGAGPTLLSGATINSGTASNYNLAINCTAGKELFVSFSYKVATNYLTTDSATTLTNLQAVFQVGDGYNWGVNGTSSGGNVGAAAPFVLTVNGNTVGTNYYALTNWTLNAVPSVKLWYITNACGFNSNCKATNVTVRYWVK